MATLVRTNLAITVSCKCGNIVAATLIIGGDTIDESFTDTMATVYNSGGEIKIINTDQETVTLGGCSCQ